MSWLVGMRKISVNVDSAGTAQAISSTQIQTPWFYVYAASGNAGSMYIGDSTVDNTWPPIAAGDKISFIAGEDSIIDRVERTTKSYVDAKHEGVTEILKRQDEILQRLDDRIYEIYKDVKKIKQHKLKE